jgi:hypothetical protein
MATAKQITKKLQKAGINLEGLKVNTNEIEICLGYKEDNTSGRNRGTCNEKLVNKTRKQIQNSLPEFNGGFQTGYGAFILQIGFKSFNIYN